MFAAAVQASKRAGRQLVKVADTNLLRYDCDPSKISDGDQDMFFKWATAKRYTPDAYADAAIWGLKGALKEAMPRSALWTGAGLKLTGNLVFLTSFDHLKVQSGTVCTGDITVTRKHPIAMVIPLARKYTGV